MGWDGKDAVGEVLREGDEVKVLKSPVGEYLPVGAVGVIGKLEPLDYSGSANRQVRVETTDDFFWMNHKWLMKV